LTCDHVARRTQHRGYDRYSLRVTDCPGCGTRRGVISDQRLGPASDPGGPVRQQRLIAELNAANSKLHRQRKAITATEKRIGELTQARS
jgi:hypothetical protein